MNPVPSVIAYQAPKASQATALPDIVPMRRGRPTKSPVTASPQVRAISTDPFAALDNAAKFSPLPPDELSARFPSVEHFSLLHDSGNKFEFKEFNPDPPIAFPPTKDFNTRVMERLADDAFVHPPVTSKKNSPVEAKPRENMEDRSPGSQPVLYQPQPQRPSMVSTGTMTSPPHSPSPSPDKLNMRVPEASSGPYSRPHSRSQDQYVPVAVSKPQKPVYLETHRSPSQTNSRHTISSRPSLESHRLASSTELISNGTRPKTTNSKARPSSVYIESNLDFLRDLDSPAREKDTTPPATSGLLTPHHNMEQNLTGQSITSQRSDHIESNVAFLRAMENESDAAKGGSKSDKRLSTGSFVGKHVKRASITSMSLSNTKTLLAGKFGDAFRRFEGNGSGDANRSSSPSNDYLGPITGSGPVSEASDEPWENTGNEEVSPEARREMEKNLLALEEERVAAAAAKYKQDMANRTPGDAIPRQSSSSRASSIQNKVKALLSENRAPAPRTAEGYGQYTDEPHYHSQQHYGQQDKQPLRPSTAEKVMMRGDIYSGLGRDQTKGPATRALGDIPQATLNPRTTVSPSNVIDITDRKLVKPLSPSNMSPTRPPPPPKPHKLRGDLEVRNLPRQDIDANAELVDVGVMGDPEEWERSFARKYPSLSGLEMVETVVGNGES